MTPLQECYTLMPSYLESNCGSINHVVRRACSIVCHSCGWASRWVVLVLGVLIALGAALPAQAASTTLVSVGTAVQSGLGGNSLNPSISADGRYIAFYSRATNLTTNKTNTTNDVFIRDTQTGTTTLVSVSSDGTSSGNAGSINPSISADGRYVAFESLATNLTANKTNSGVYDVFVRDTQTNTTKLVSIGTNGTSSGNASSYAANYPFSPSISSDGRYIAF